ncbi:MAG: molecular chaperone DnaJ [Rickettsiales bacterium]
MSTDYYKILGVEKNASDAEIKKAYNKLALKYHPDRNQGDKKAEEKFKEITNAKEVLLDPNKRAYYDRTGSTDSSHYNKSNAGGGNGGFNSGFGGFGDFEDLEDLFSQFMGGGRSGRSSAKSYKGRDLEYNMQITLEEAFFGVEKTIKFSTLCKCESCNGQGSKNGTVSTCSTCNGNGSVYISKGFFKIQQTCSKCNGTGKSITNPCGSCKGVGNKQDSKTLNIKLQTGIENGTKMKLEGQGEAGSFGAKAGDLYVNIEIMKHKTFTLKNQDLYAELNIGYLTAILGEIIQIKSIDGSAINVTIPECSQHNQVIQIPSQGMKYFNSNRRGNLYLNIKIELPTKITKEEKELFNNLKELNKKSSSFFSKFW